MKAFFAILQAEMRGRKTVFLAVALLGLLPLTAPLWSTLRSFDVDGARVASAMALSLLVTLGGAVGLGGSMVVGKQAEGRLDFFLARPMSGWALWMGQLTAAILSLWLSWWLAWIPTMLLGGSPAQFVDRGLFLSRGTWIPLLRPWNPPQPFEGVTQWVSTMPGPLSSQTVWFFTIWAMLCLLLLALSHWVSMVLRLRTRWVLLDVLMLGLTVMLGSHVFGRLYGQMAFRDLTWAAYGFGLTVVLSVFWAGGWQVAQGGVLPTRSHRMFSSWFWPLPILVLLMLAGYERWLVSRQPEDLAALVNLHASPDGEWWVVSGKVWQHGSYEPVFAYHPESGRHHPLGSRFALPFPPTFAGHGHALTWIECPIIGFTCEVRWLALDGSGQRSSFPVPRTGLWVLDGPPGQRLALSDEGDVLAIAHAGRLDVMAMPEQTLLTTQRIGESYHRLDLDFQPGSVLRAYVQYLATTSPRLEIWKLDLTDQVWQQHEALEGFLRAFGKAADRLLVQTRRGAHKLFDGWGTTEIGFLSNSSFKGLHAVRFLSSGELISFETDGRGQSSLRHYGRDGQPKGQFPLQDGELALLGGELASGRLLVGLRRGPGGNVATGALASSIDGLEIPALGSWRRWRSRLLDVREGWVDGAWPEHIPAWQRADSVFQSDLLLSTDGVKGLEPSATGYRPVSLLSLRGD